MKFQEVRGMRDLLPEQARRKQFIEDRIRREFEAYGFEPIETPVLEEFELLAVKGGAGEAIKEEIYYFKDKSERELGMRFDLTVPLARVVANNPQLAKPFKRYQIGKVYRYDRPGLKRWREFTQADVDIVGSASTMADFEIVALAYKTMKNFGLKFVIKIANKALLEQIGLANGVPTEKLNDCFRSLDKFDKIGIEGVRKELEEKKIPTKILEVIKQNDLKKIDAMVKDKKGLSELKELLNYCNSAGLGEFVKFDASLARGLEYYTGNVFEICIEGAPSVGGGGRYDNLIELYGGPKTPAVGISFGVDRLLDALEANLPLEVKTKVFVAPIYKELPDWEYENDKKTKIVRIPDRKIAQYMVEVASAIRALGINCEIDLMMRNIKRNLQNIAKKGIPFVAIVGEDELNDKSIILKNLSTEKQEKIKLSELRKIIEEVKKQEEFDETIEKLK